MKSTHLLKACINYWQGEQKNFDQDIEAETQWLSFSDLMFLYANRILICFV